MELSYMLNQMCHEALSNADINAIRKMRGFTQRETESRSKFESFFLSSIGIVAAMNALTPKETATLYLLNRKSEAVDLTFFERVYGSDRQKYYHRTFTQQYKDTFTAVKQKLLRRGLLVMAELRTRSDNTKMERWRFRFPPEFAAYLPPLIADPHHFEGAGDDRSTAAQRAKVLEALDTLKAKQPPQKGSQVLVERGFQSPGCQCTECEAVVMESLDRCPYCAGDLRQSSDVVNLAVQKAIGAGLKVSVLGPSDSLTKVGQIAALLRY